METALMLSCIRNEFSLAPLVGLKEGMKAIFEVRNVEGQTTDYRTITLVVTHPRNVHFWG